MNTQPCPGCGRLILSHAGLLAGLRELEEEISGGPFSSHDISRDYALTAIHDLRAEADCGLGCADREALK